MFPRFSPSTARPFCEARPEIAWSEVTGVRHRIVKELDPAVRATSGLSNIRFGMPSHKTVNQAFLTLALAAGMDSAIMDPLDREMTRALPATEALIGSGPRGRRCYRGYRSHRFDPVGAAAAT